MCKRLHPDSKPGPTQSVFLQISFYDAQRGSLDLVGRVYATGAMGVPQCLDTAFIERDEREHVVYGDSAGGVIMLNCSDRELPARDLVYDTSNNPDAQRDYEYIQSDPKDRHKDWVTQVNPKSQPSKSPTALKPQISSTTAVFPFLLAYWKVHWRISPKHLRMFQVTEVRELGLVSSSLDGKVKITDISRGKVLHNVAVHSKGVNAFAYCKAFSVVVSGGNPNPHSKPWF